MPSLISLFDIIRAIVGVAFIVFGIISIAKPKTMWELNKGVKANETLQPPSSYLVLLRILGIVEVLIGLAMVLWPLLMIWMNQPHVS